MICKACSIYLKINVTPPNRIKYKNHMIISKTQKKKWTKFNIN